jgi:uroporphyrinogen decarboxylase
MNGLSRIQAAVHFEGTDRVPGGTGRVPVIAQVFAHTAIVTGETVYDYVRSGRTLAACQMKALSRYGYDAVFALMDANVETEAAGSKLSYRQDDYPYVQSHAFSRETDLDAVPVPDPTVAGRMPEILAALRILRAEVGNDVLVSGCVLGPMTLASQLLGMENALYLALDDPPSFEKLLDFSTRVAIRFGVAQIENGAHLPFVFDPGASPAVVPAGFFRELELPRLKRVFAAFRGAGAIAGWLHIAGPTAPILPFIPESGADILNFDYCVDPREVMNKAPDLCCDGNIRPIDFEEAEPEKIRSDSMNLRDLFAVRGGFILSSGCEIPLRSRPENVDALVAAACGPP